MQSTTSLSDIQSKVNSCTTQDQMDQYFADVLIARGNIAPKKYDRTGYNELHWSALLNQVERIAALLEKFRVDVNATTRNRGSVTRWDCTPMMLATIHRRIGFVNALLNFHANYNIGYTYQVCRETFFDYSLHFHVLKGPSPKKYAENQKIPEIVDLIRAHESVNSFAINEKTIQSNESTLKKDHKDSKDHNDIHLLTQNLFDWTFLWSLFSFSID